MCSKGIYEEYFICFLGLDFETLLTFSNKFSICFNLASALLYSSNIVVEVENLMFWLFLNFLKLLLFLFFVI